MLEQKQITFATYQHKYKKGHQISRGQFGRVYWVQNVQERHAYALKIIQCKTMREREETLAEIQIQTILQHQFVVKIFEYYDRKISTSECRYECQIGIIMELGLFSLQKCIADASYHYTIKQVRTFLARFIQLGAFFQKKGIVHRDIKPANVIIFGDSLEFKLSDFGLSCYSDRRPNGYAGTLRYSSPIQMRLHDRKDKRLKPISNPYKDDVYSMAITVQEMLKKIQKQSQMKGSKPLQNLQKSSFKQLTLLLDEMLKNRQEERPDFLELMRRELVQSQLFEESAKFNSEEYRRLSIDRKSKVQHRTFKKIDEKVYEEQFHTEIRQYRPHYESVCFNVGNFSVRTLCRLNSTYILCGTAEGELFVLNLTNEETSLVRLKLGNFVARITTDKDGNIWTAGGDGKIYVLNRQEFIICVQQHKTQNLQKKSIFGTIINKEERFVQISESAIVAVLTTPKENISFIECIDVQTYAVGYCDGFVFVKNTDESVLYQTYSDMITSIKFISDCVFSSGYAGMIKIYNLSTKRIQTKIYDFAVPIIDFHYSQPTNKIGIISCYGHHETINLLDQYSFNRQLKQKNVIACVFNSGQGDCFYMTDTGAVYSGDDKVYACAARQGWNCLVSEKDNELLMGSFEGQVAIINIK